MDLKIAERECNRKITVFDYHPKLPAGILTSLLLQGPLYMWDAIVLPAVKGTLECTLVLYPFLCLSIGMWGRVIGGAFDVWWFMKGLSFIIIILIVFLISVFWFLNHSY